MGRPLLIGWSSSPACRPRALERTPARTQAPLPAGGMVLPAHDAPLDGARSPFGFAWGGRCFDHAVIGERGAAHHHVVEVRFITEVGLLLVLPGDQTQGTRD